MNADRSVVFGMCVRSWEDNCPSDGNRRVCLRPSTDCECQEPSRNRAYAHIYRILLRSIPPLWDRGSDMAVSLLIAMSASLADLMASMPRIPRHHRSLPAIGFWFICFLFHSNYFEIFHRLLLMSICCSNVGIRHTWQRYNKNSDYAESFEDKKSFFPGKLPW